MHLYYIYGDHKYKITKKVLHELYRELGEMINIGFM
jgi:hypothetical protein